MSSLIQRYLEYRRVGHSPLAAFRFAWLVASVRQAAIRLN